MARSQGWLGQRRRNISTQETVAVMILGMIIIVITTIRCNSDTRPAAAGGRERVTNGEDSQGNIFLESLCRLSFPICKVGLSALPSSQRWARSASVKPTASMRPVVMADWDIRLAPFPFVCFFFLRRGKRIGHPPTITARHRARMRTIHTKAFGLPVYAHGWPHSGLTVMSWPQYSEFPSRHWEKKSIIRDTHTKVTQCSVLPCRYTPEPKTSGTRQKGRKGPKDIYKHRQTPT